MWKINVNSGAWNNQTIIVNLEKASIDNLLLFDPTGPGRMVGRIPSSVNDMDVPNSEAQYHGTME
jgi:hypothetical protein